MLEKKHGSGEYEEAVQQWMLEREQAQTKTFNATEEMCSEEMCSPLNVFAEGEHKDKDFASKVVVEMKDNNYQITEASKEALGKKVSRYVLGSGQNKQMGILFCSFLLVQPSKQNSAQIRRKI